MSEIPKGLADALNGRTLVPFAGAGVSAAVRSKDAAPAFPTWRGLLERAVERLHQETLVKKANLVRALLEDGDHLGAAEKARQAFGAAWTEFLREQFDPSYDHIDQESLALARLIWRLGSSLIVTTNYDKVLHWGCPPAARNDLRHWTSVDSANFPSIQAGVIDKPTVWHLHGFVENAAEIILTPGGYQLLYPDDANVKTGYEGALSTLRHLLTARTLLFIGFSMEEALQGEIRWVREAFAGAGRAHYILARESERFGFERELNGLSVQVIPFADFGAPLLALLNQLSSCVGSRQRGSHVTPLEDREIDPLRYSIREDTLLDRVKAVYLVKGSQVEQLLGPTPVGAYLRVTRPHGDCFPVAAGSVTPESIRAFADSIVSLYRAHDPSVPAHFIYGTDTVPAAEVRELARQARIDIGSFVVLQGLIDFSPYLKRLEGRLADSRYPSSLFVPQHLTYWLGRERKEEEDAREAVWKWLNQPSGGFVVILGNFGSGKSFLIREIARRFLAQGSITPVLIDLRRLNRSQNLEGLLATHLAQESFEEFNLKAFDYMIKEGRLALLFDGYDELELRVGYGQAAEHFQTICAAAGGRARVAVSSRTQHFKSDEQVLKLLGQRAETAGARLVNLAPFDRSRIRSWLVKRLGSGPAADQRLDLLDHVRDLSRLAENPRMLSFICEDIPVEKLEAARRRGERITEASLYQELLDWWINAEVKLANPDGERPGLTEAHLWSAIENLALRCWQDGLDDFSLDHLAEASRALGQTGMDLEVAMQQTGARSLLVREGERFRFLHFSIVEWLVARAATRDLASTGEMLGKREMSPLMARFLLGLADASLVANWTLGVLAKGETPAAKSNALLILKESGIPERIERQERAQINLEGQDLRGRDLTDAHMPGANLRTANLEGVVAVRANLEGADLRGARLAESDLTDARMSGADLSGADLSFAKLNGADLTSVRWDELTRARGAQMLGVTKDAGALRAPVIGGELGGTRPKAFVTPRGEEVASLSLSPDGQLMASASGTVILIRHVRSGQPLRVLSGHSRDVRSVAFDPQGRWLASGSDDGTVNIWEVEGGRLERTLKGHGSVVFSVAFNPQGRWRLASGSDDGTVKIWEGDMWRTLGAHENWVRSVAFDPQGRWVGSGSDDGTVKIWEAESGRLERTLEGHENGVLSVSFGLPGRWLASGSADGTVKIWEAESGRLERTLEGHGNVVRSVVFGPGGRWVASGSDDRTVKIWEAASGHLERTLEDHGSVVWSVAFDPQGQWLASSFDDDTVKLWDGKSGRLARTLEGHGNVVLSVAFDPQGRWLATGSADNTVKIWDAKSGRLERMLEGHGNVVRSIAFDPHGRWLASGSADGTVKIWKAKNGNLARTLTGEGHVVLCVAFDPQGRWLANGAADGNVKIWEAGSGRFERTLEGHGNVVRSLAFDPHGRWLATGSSPMVKIWDLESGHLRRTLEGHLRGVRSVAFDPRGQWLASASADGTVKIWDAESGRLERTLEGHGNGVASVAFDPQGRWVASGSWDGTIRLWDMKTWRGVATLFATTEGWVAFRPDGKYRFAGNLQGHFWHAIGLARYEPGEIERYLPHLRLGDDEPLIEP